jgi:hypothetical protein
MGSADERRAGVEVAEGLAAGVANMLCKLEGTAPKVFLLGQTSASSSFFFPRSGGNARGYRSIKLPQRREVA